jgi:hypothetical protein
MASNIPGKVISKKEGSKCSGDEIHYGNCFIQARNKLQQTA